MTFEKEATSKGVLAVLIGQERKNGEGAAVRLKGEEREDKHGRGVQERISAKKAGDAGGEVIRYILLKRNQGPS